MRSAFETFQERQGGRTNSINLFFVLGVTVVGESGQEENDLGWERGRHEDTRSSQSDGFTRTASQSRKS